MKKLNRVSLQYIYFRIKKKSQQHIYEDTQQICISPLIRKKKAPVSLATALAIRVFPVPGGPYSSIPLGGCEHTMSYVNNHTLEQIT